MTKVVKMNVTENQNKKTKKEVKNNVDEQNSLGVSDEARKNLIDDFNKHFGEYAELVDEEVSQEFKDSCKKEYEEYITSVQKEEHEIADEDNALEVAKFLQSWNEKFNHWEAQGWKGVIYFDKIIEEIISNLLTEKKPLRLKQDVLLWLYGSMMKPQGNGIESARAMEILETDPNVEDSSVYNTEAITYTNILEKVGKRVDYLKLANNKIQILQQKWALAESGIKMNLKITELEEFEKFMQELNKKGN